MASGRHVPTLQTQTEECHETSKNTTAERYRRKTSRVPTGGAVPAGGVRRTIRKALPGAEEPISCRIPTFKLNGRYVLCFAGWKEHYSLYPSTDRLIAALQDDLAPYEVNDKGTIRFPHSRPVPVKLIADIAKFRPKEDPERGAMKIRGKAR
jgi:uncharacterized protein YdhG (YjbR/CyaY superfamily)